MKLKYTKKIKSRTFSVYLPETLLIQAKKKGMNNLSGFVRTKLEEFMENDQV
jgi:hypothetical protein